MSYTADDIKSLSFKEGVRTRIQMYLGSSDNEGIYQAFKEIINNSTDEALAGYGNQIDISVNEETNTISIRDYGRGVPFKVKEDGTNVLVDIYTKSHTGGKFDNNVYKNASGLNGIGGSCVCLSATNFKVQSFRDGTCATAEFFKGDLTNYNESSTKEQNGTLVIFSPDPEVFKDEKIGYSFKRLCEDIHNISYLCNGITFNLVNDKTKEKKSYCAKNGIMDFVKDNNKHPLNENIIHKTVTDGTDTVEIAFQWGDKKEKSYVFVNGLLCGEGGSPVTGAKSALTKSFNALARTSCDGDIIRDGLFYVINCTVTNPSFANQTKTKINNPNLRTLASEAFSDGLKEMARKYPEDFEKVAEVLKRLERAEAAADKARLAILNHEKEMITNNKQKIIDSNKLRDAKQLGDDSILLCVEGLSAGGSMSTGRVNAENGDNIGILMLRGKCINAMSNSIEDILDNEEVKLLFQALGLIYGQNYNNKKLRYGKIAIATDSDFDGNHIGLLIMAILQELIPEIIQEGRLYWLRAPIYKVTNKKGNFYYYSEEEFKNHEDGEIVKYKGLGQMDDTDIGESMMSSKWQHLEQIVPSVNGIDRLYELMGPDVDPRKEFVKQIDFKDFEL